MLYFKAVKVELTLELVRNLATSDVLSRKRLPLNYIIITLNLNFHAYLKFTYAPPLTSRKLQKGNAKQSNFYVFVILKMSKVSLSI